MASLKVQVVGKISIISISSSSSSYSNEEDSSELKLNLQQLSRNKHFPKDKQNINKLVKNYGRLIKHAPNSEENGESNT